jgi:dimeric dUTPase (all-alpha-NTP-PPase superfamily)
MLSDESIELLRNKQEELDKIIRENSRIRRKLKCYDWKESAKRLKLALFVEIGEFSNEVKSFKH